MGMNVSIHGVASVKVGEAKCLHTSSGGVFAVRHITITDKLGAETVVTIFSDDVDAIELEVRS